MAHEKTRMVRIFLKIKNFRGCKKRICAQALVLSCITAIFHAQELLGAPSARRPSPVAPRANPSSNGSTDSRANGVKTPSGQLLTPKKLSTSGLYYKAREFFAAGRYAEAIQYGAAAQRRTAQSKLPTVLVAQSYYRLGKTARAAKLFLTVPISELPKEASVDYILTMFSVRRYGDVIKAYQLVPDQHPYRDVARFYLGSSYLQLRLYQKANAALRSARKIPPRLKSERRELLAYIRTLQQAEKQGRFASAPQYSNFAQMGYLQPPVEPEVARPALPGGAPGKVAPPKPSPPKSGIAFFVTPGLAMSVKSSKEDYGGYVIKQSDSQTPKYSLELGAKYLGEPRSFGGQPSFDFSFKPSYSNTEGRTTTSALVAPDSDPTSVQNVTTRSENKSNTQAQELSLSAKIPVSEPIDLGANYGLTNTVRKSPEKSETERTSLGGRISGDFEEIDFGLDYTNESLRVKGISKPSVTSTAKLSVSHGGEDSTTAFSATVASYNPESGGISSSTNLEITWSRNLGDFNLELGAAKLDNKRKPLTAAGQVISQVSEKADLTYSLGVGLSTTATVIFSQIGVLPVANGDSVPDAPEEVIASGSATQYVINIKYSPTGFVSAGVLYDYTERALKVGDERFKMKLIKENWSQNTVTTINLAFNYTF